MIPIFNLIYYKALIDKCFIEFFNDYNDFFQKIDDKYVLSKELSKNQIKNYFKLKMKEILLPYLKPYSIIEPNYYLIIGAGMPKDNLLLNFKDGYFPEKLNKLINADFQYKYLLKESDIKIDLIRFNSALIELFNDMFKSTRNVLRLFGSNMTNVIFIQHKNLDCYSMFKTIKYIYGKNNCKNLYEEYFKNDKSCLIAVNDLIDRYVQNKVMMNKSQEFKNIVDEVKQFLDEKIKDIQNGQK